jgi:hypothetical protein
MSSTGAKPAHAETPETMSKAEVCDYVGKSKRTIDSYIATGRLRVGYFNGPNGKTGIFQRADVEALKKDLEAPTYRAVVPPAERERSRDGYQALQIVAPPAGAALTQQQPAADAFTALAEHLAKLAAYPARSPKPWLTLDEAVEWSGLTRGYLLYLTETDAVGVRDMGKHSRGGRWRFNREALAK